LRVEYLAGLGAQWGLDWAWAEGSDVSDLLSSGKEGYELGPLLTAYFHCSSSGQKKGLWAYAHMYLCMYILLRGAWVGSGCSQ
jgi:hypothetical protein